MFMLEAFADFLFWLGAVKLFAILAFWLGIFTGVLIGFFVREWYDVRLRRKLLQEQRGVLKEHTDAGT